MLREYDLIELEQRGRRLRNIITVESYVDKVQKLIDTYRKIIHVQDATSRLHEVQNIQVIHPSLVEDETGHHVKQF